MTYETKKRVMIGVALVVAVVLLVGAYSWWTRPPQMGVDAEVFRTVDALYTAVTARDEKLLGQCEKRLNDLKAAGRLPTTPADYLDSVIATARQGRWQPAAERLYAFMSVQRRDGADRRK